MRIVETSGPIRTPASPHKEPNTIEEAIHGKENDFVNVIALSGTTPIEENIKLLEAFLNAKENIIDPVYKKRVDQIVEYEND